MLKRKYLWPITIFFAVFFYLAFAFGVPYFLGQIPESVGVEGAGAGETVINNVRRPFHLVGLVAAIVILIQPLVSKIKK